MADLPAGTSISGVGQSPAEQAGNKALRSDALTNRATNPAAVLGPADRALSNKPVASAPAAAPVAFPLSGPKFFDKLMGMMLLGAYGDALGAAHEMNGLDGKVAVGNPVANELRAFNTYERRIEPQPFGVWRLPESPTETGMVTDDTGVRVMMLYQFLRVIEHVNYFESSNGLTVFTKPDEIGYVSWLDSMKGEPTGTPPEAYKTVLNTRKSVISSYFCWLNNARRYEAAKASGTSFTTGDCTPEFWQPATAVVFGQFLYLELAAIYAGCDRAKVLAEFSTFSILDQGEAKFSTGLLAAVLSQALVADPSQNFTDFFNTQVEEILTGPGAQLTLQTAWVHGKTVGTANIGKTLNEVMSAIKTSIFDPCKPLQSPKGLGKFAPSLFLAQMAAVVQWGAGKPRDILGALAFGAGDSDTIPAQLGSIMGAFFGETALRSKGLASGLDTVKNSVEKYFTASAVPGEAVPFDFAESADLFMSLAARHGPTL